MTRGNARELAVHLIYGRNFTGEEPESVVATRLNKEYYGLLSGENDVYAERPSRAQMVYIDGVVAGVAFVINLTGIKQDEALKKYDVFRLMDLSDQ